MAMSLWQTREISVIFHHRFSSCFHSLSLEADDKIEFSASAVKGNSKEIKMNFKLITVSCVNLFIKMQLILASRNERNYDMMWSVTCNAAFAIIINCVEINNRIIRFFNGKPWMFSLEKLCGSDELGELHMLKGLKLWAMKLMF